MLRFPKPCLAATALVLATTGAARADEAPASAEKKVEYGVGVRLRSVRAPKGMIEWFIESAPGGVANTGLGVDLVRRRGNVELQLGFEFENIQPAEGVWIETGSNVAAGDEADYIVSPENNGGKKLGWFTIEFTFLNHTPIIGDRVALRYGGGLGLGIVTGELGRYDVFCNGATNETPEPGCVPSAFGGAATNTGERPGEVVAYDLPPVFPVVNAILGLQIRPVSKAVINIEGGIRTFPFFGASAGYFF